MEVPVSAILGTKVLFVQNVSGKLYCSNWFLHVLKRFSSLHFDFSALLVSLTNCGLQVVQVSYLYSVYIVIQFFLIV
jgi:hypothetical protein